MPAEYTRPYSARTAGHRRRSWAARIARASIFLVVALFVLYLIVYAFFYRVFSPSASNEPTLIVGDKFAVSLTAYGYSHFTFFDLVPFQGRIFASAPRRGDLVVFKLPRDNKTEYVKRLIGLPNEEIAVRDGVVFIDGKKVVRRRIADFTTLNDDGKPQAVPAYEETLPDGRQYDVLDTDKAGPFDNVGPYKVPEGHYFVLGDNRDNSVDSRASWGVGYVPFDNFLGRVDLILERRGDPRRGIAHARWVPLR